MTDNYIINWVKYSISFLSQFVGVEGLVTAFVDTFPVLKRRKQLFVGCLCIIQCLVGLSMVTEVMSLLSLATFKGVFNTWSYLLTLVACLNGLYALLTLESAEKIVNNFLFFKWQIYIFVFIAGWYVHLPVVWLLFWQQNSPPRLFLHVCHNHDIW